MSCSNLTVTISEIANRLKKLSEELIDFECTLRHTTELQELAEELKKINNINLLAQIKQLSGEDRELLFSNFCRNCSADIEEPDWTGLNYCYMCSPDPNSRDF